MDSHQKKNQSANSLVKFLQLNSIRSRLIFVLAIFSILPVAVTGLFINTISGNFARAKVQDSLQAVAALKGSQVRSWAKELQVNMSTGVSQDIKDLSVTLLRTEPNSLIYGILYQREMDNFDRIVKTLPLYEELMLLDGKGTVILSTTPDRIGQNLGAKEFFKQMMGRAGTNATFDQEEVCWSGGRT